MTREAEVRRLNDVYRQYRESAAVQAQWSQSNPGNRAILRERDDALEKILRKAGYLPLSGRSVLDLGCGSGTVLASLIQWGARPEELHGIDLLPERVAAAHNRFPELDIRQANAEQLDFSDNRFDLLLLYSVFTSILDQGMARNVAGEVRRVLRPGGAVVWYDFRFNNPRNPNVRGMGKAAIQALFPDFDLQLRSITLLPPLARRLRHATDLLYPVLSRLAALQTHYLGLLVKR